MNTYNLPVDWRPSWFDKSGDRFVGEIQLPIQDESLLREILLEKPGTPLVGEIPVGEVHREAIEKLAGMKLDLSCYDYFIGAVAR